MRELALNCLAWMIYARRPLSTRELQHALATNSKCKIRQDLQPDSPGVILEACGNLLEEISDTIRPIHYTVQEFLITVAQGLSKSTIRTQLLDSNSVHTRLSVACLKYIHLIAFDKPQRSGSYLYNRLQHNVFAGYASQNFDYHISKCDEISSNTMEQLEKLFQQESQYLAAVLQIRLLRDGFEYDGIVRYFDRMQFSVSASTIVYSTSLYNIPAVRQLWVDDKPPEYALHLASSAGLIRAVVRLLDAGCDVNEGDGSGGTPLYYACSEAHLEIIQMLLKEGADIKAQGGYYGNALNAASEGGHKEIVTLLVDKGVDVNTQGGHYGNALQAASAGGHKEIVTLLVDKGVGVNAQGGRYGNALQAASEGGHKEIVTLLVDKGADVNAQGGYYGNALQAASARGHKEIVTLLVDKGVDVNAQGGHYGNALQAASAGGHKEIVTLLIDKGVDVNAQGGRYGNALNAASEGGHKEIVTLLVDKGVDVNAQGGYFGNALQGASDRGHKEIVTLLVNKGANG
jgi:ankyrin repeat protein